MSELIIGINNVVFVPFGVSINYDQSVRNDGYQHIFNTFTIVDICSCCFPAGNHFKITLSGN
jgi:hypothetical protein